MPFLVSDESLVHAAVQMPTMPLPPGTFALEISGQYKGANETAVFSNVTGDCTTLAVLDRANHYGLTNYNSIPNSHQVRLPAVWHLCTTSS